MRNLAFYMTIHYPDRARFFQILELLDRVGAGYVEIGIPVSEPYMDGETIRQTHREVLDYGLTAEEMIQTLTDIRAKFSFRTVLMTYREGVERFRLKEVPKELYDGFICVDSMYPPEVLKNQIAVLDHEIGMEELRQKLAGNRLFAYVVSGSGKTGSVEKQPERYMEVVERVKAVSEVPAFVGFGVKSVDDVREILRNGADGAIIGTEFIRRYQLGGMEALEEYLGEF